MEINDIDSLELLEALQEGVVVHDATTKILYANPRALEILRLTEEQALGKDAIDPEWRLIDSNSKVMPHQKYPVNRVLSEKEPICNLEVGISDSTYDRVTWVLCNAYPQFDSSGNIAKIIVGFIDISSQKSDIPFEAIIANANDVILVTDATPVRGDGPRIVYVNHAFCELTGYTPSEVIGKTPRILQGDDTSSETRNKIYEALKNKLPIRETILNYSKAGVPYWLDMNIFPLENALGEITYFAAVERDISCQIEKEVQLKDLATKDPLTGLLNRRGFFDLARMRLTNQSEEKISTIAIIDVDFFKRVNDSFGHDCGDTVLKYISSFLREVFRESDLVCRYGGEEFVALLPGVNTNISQKKIELFREKVAGSPIDIGDGNSITVTVSIGIAEIQKGSLSIESALNEADKALYKAKKSARNMSIVAG